MIPVSNNSVAPERLKVKPETAILFTSPPHLSGGTGSGSTSPAGSNTQIQFNDSGSFGANTGFTFDTTNQTLFTESNVSGASVNFYNGLSNFDVGNGSMEAIGTTTIYNADTIGSASGFTMFIMGDLTDVFVKVLRLMN